MVSFKELYQQLLPTLPPTDGAPSEHELLWLFSHYTGLSKAELRQPGALDIEADEPTAAAIRRAVESRRQNVPLQYITGLQPFWDFDLIVSPDVLIPRWDSETVLEQALRLIPPNMPNNQPPAVADICTGSGAYALTIKHERPNAQLIATDISPAALAIARQNAAKYNLQIDFRQGDLLKALPSPQRQQYHLITCNPPYVETNANLPPDVQQEPALALFGGADGLDFYRRLTQEGVFDYLRPGGWLLLEIGSAQAAAVSGLLHQAGFSDIQTGQDLAGRDRWVQGQRPANQPATTLKGVSG